MAIGMVVGRRRIELGEVKIKNGRGKGENYTSRGKPGFAFVCKVTWRDRTWCWFVAADHDPFSGKWVAPRIIRKNPHIQRKVFRALAVLMCVDVITGVKAEMIDKST
jgi:hypothetical protein